MTTTEMFSQPMKRVCLPEWVTAVSSLGTFLKIPMKAFLVEIYFERLSASHVSRSCLIAALAFTAPTAVPTLYAIILKQATLLVNVRTTFCKKNKLIFDMLFKKLKRNDPDEMDVFWSWISCRSLKEVRGEDA